MTEESIAVLDYYIAALSHTPADFNNTSEGWDSFCCHWGAELYFEMLPTVQGRIYHLQKEKFNIFGNSDVLPLWFHFAI